MNRFDVSWLAVDDVTDDILDDLPRFFFQDDSFRYLKGGALSAFSSWKDQDGACPPNKDKMVHIPIH